MSHTSPEHMFSRITVYLREGFWINQISVLVAWLGQHTWGKSQMDYIWETQDMAEPEISTERKSKLEQ